MSAIEYIPKPIRLGLCLLVLIGIVFVLDNIQHDLARSQYPLTYEYTEVNITERMTTSSNCGYIISDDGTRYHICGSLFWNTTPNHRYKVEQAYNYSTREAALTFGKTDPFITSVERIP